MPSKKKPPAPISAKPQASELTLIRDLAKILNETGLTEIELNHKGAHVRVSKSVHVTASVPTHTSAPPQQATSSIPAPTNLVGATTRDPASILKSPMVGTAYLAPTPGAPNFAIIGATVKQGQTLLIIEAMKTMNQIFAHQSGKITEILIENGGPVEFGEALMVIE